MDGLDFGTPKTYKNRSGHDVTEWPDGLKLVRFADGRVKVGRQGSVLRGGPRGVTAQEFRSGSNPTAHVIAAFDNPQD
ncbi:MAG: hypothetical protein NTX68_00375 [Rhodococcus sp.]|jgi:hypothetical protein|nr:hypothetical protein [Rhodococcus sp. (in: high G+C Gram-positive bacteria)]MCX6489429.1 hypothetical protein [Rhodococcus sp. (in: high G+C Gram-positive bacteria)]